jgi:hypothetical protein
MHVSSDNDNVEVSMYKKPKTFKKQQNKSAFSNQSSSVISVDSDDDSIGSKPQF